MKNKNLREKLLNDKELLKRSIKENSQFSTADLLNIVADLIDYTLNDNDLEDNLEKNNKKFNQNFDEAKEYNNLFNYNIKFKKIGFKSIDDFFDRLSNDIYIFDSNEFGAAIKRVLIYFVDEYFKFYSIKDFENLKGEINE
jgi:hypothetical protein